MHGKDVIPGCGTWQQREPPCPRGGPLAGAGRWCQVFSLWGTRLGAGLGIRSCPASPQLHSLPRQQHALWQLRAIAKAQLIQYPSVFSPGSWLLFRAGRRGWQPFAGTASSFPSLMARWILGYPLLSVGSHKRWHWERVSCLGKSPTAIAALKIKEILPGTVLALQEDQGTALGSSKYKPGTGRSTGLPIPAVVPPAQTPEGFGVTRWLPAHARPHHLSGYA